MFVYVELLLSSAGMYCQCVLSQGSPTWLHCVAGALLTQMGSVGWLSNMYMWFALVGYVGVALMLAPCGHW